jgi:glycosyltransferase involved in cell wall biosynthesis
LGATSAEPPPSKEFIVRVLAITNGWPTAKHPEYCIFNERQVESLRSHDVAVDVAFVNAREDGKLAYLSWLPRLAWKARGYDLVHCFHGLAFLLAHAAGVRRPKVVSFLNAIDHEYADVPAFLRPHLVALTKRIVSAPDASCGVVVKDAIPPELSGRPHVRHIPNGVDLETFRPGDKLAARAALGLDPEAVYLLFVSSKDLRRRQKRYDRFAAVLAAYRAAHPELRVEAITLVSEPDVLTSYQAADVHVLTSDFEGSPNSVKEALACELPVVSTDVGNVGTMLEGLACARVLPSFSAEAAVRAIDAVRAAAPESRGELRRSLAERGLDTDSAARRLLDLYEFVLDSPAGRGRRHGSSRLPLPGCGADAR